jgi:RNA polymerase sigma-70 factor (ECF subfamily)
VDPPPPWLTVPTGRRIEPMMEAGMSTSSDVLGPVFRMPAWHTMRAVWSARRDTAAAGRARRTGRSVGAAAPPGGPADTPPDGADLEPAAAEALMREIVDRHRVPLHRFLTRLLLGQDELAEDVVQETLLRAWRNRAMLAADPAKIAPWLYTVARHAAIDAMRARQARPPEVSLPDLNRIPAADDEMDRVVSVHSVRRALTQISPEHRQVLLEIYYRNASVAQAAQRLGIPEGTVKSRAYYAVRSLHAAINASPEDGS